MSSAQPTLARVSHDSRTNLRFLIAFMRLAARYRSGCISGAALAGLPTRTRLLVWNSPPWSIGAISCIACTARWTLTFEFVRSYVNFYGTSGRFLCDRQRHERKDNAFSHSTRDLLILTTLVSLCLRFPFDNRSNSSSNHSIR